MEMKNSEGKRGTGLLAVISRINEEMLSSPNDKKLTKSSVHRAVSRGQFGGSPVKNGRPSKVPLELTRGLACHAVMMQISGEGEASSLKMRAIAAAVMLGTPHENMFSTDYLWRRTRMDHPALINPSRAINNEDRHVDWLTYRNIIKWNKRAKEFLVEIKMGKDEREFIRTCSCLFTSIPTITKLAFLFCFISDEIESEMSLIHEDDVDWFLTMDKTHHLFLTVGAKGGATAGRYTNPSFPRSWE